MWPRPHHSHFYIVLGGLPNSGALICSPHPSSPVPKVCRPRCSLGCAPRDGAPYIPGSALAGRVRVWSVGSCSRCRARTGTAGEGGDGRGFCAPAERAPGPAGRAVLWARAACFITHSASARCPSLQCRSSLRFSHNAEALGVQVLAHTPAEARGPPHGGKGQQPCGPGLWTPAVPRRMG